MAKFRPSTIEAMMGTYSQFRLDDAQLKQLRSVLESGRVGVTQTNDLVTDLARNELATGAYGPGSTQTKQNLLDFIKKNSNTGSAPTPAPAKPKVTPQEFVESKKAAVKPQVTPKPQVAPTPAPTAPAPTATPAPASAKPKLTPKVTTPSSSILSSGPVTPAPDPSKMSTKQLLNGGRPTPKPAVPTATPAKGIFGGRMAGLAKYIPSWATRAVNSPFGRALTSGGSLLFGRDDGSANLLLGAMETADMLRPGQGLMQTNEELQSAGLMPKPESTQQSIAPKSVVENPNDDWADPIAGKGPKGNEVGSDYAPSEPGIQGSGDPKSVGSNPWAIWANKYKGLAEKVKPGQAGYEEIQIALGKTPQNPYSGAGDFTLGDKDVSEVYKPTIDLKSDIAPITDDFKVNYNTAPEGYTAGNSDLLYASASAFQQPNFDGTSQPIGGNTPEKSQPVQDFTNANTNPGEVDGYLGHPLNIKPSAEAEAANAEYGAMKFEFDPAKNMMVRVK